ncbi:alpha-terpineol synthase, chloroplastic-like [Oryza glaberrima]|uniref:alpha-terpineol synthase, chloroplastic-like n=1 Tax=Oryza glaberrima TaxID=4538 RepID=UPI00224BFEBA|nr:alpha-terpineol synthase, chloroplastic-like [Oryza glaberrima]
MASFSVHAQPWSSSCQPAAAASSQRQCSTTPPWRRPWRQPRTRSPGTLRCRQAQQQLLLSTGVIQQDAVDDRLNKNPCNFHPSIWGDFFLYHSSTTAASYQQQEWIVQLERLKEEVGNMITSSVTSSLLERLHLIDALERLCVNHLFEEEINILLMQISSSNNVNDCDDVHTVAMWFYLLRKHGYKVSQDVFVKFKDEEGNFIAKNPMDLLALYNAAHYRVHGEKILDDAILFTKRCLHSMLPSLEGSLAREVKCALEIPLPRRVGIYEANYYISTYEKEGKVHDMIVQLAKLNFNLMQLQYQEELDIITRWWKDLQIQSKLPFARDRIVECYLWMLGVYYEPNCSRGRIILTKVISIATIFDDTFDSYGTIEECELFTKCLESWELVADELPDCMKHVLEKVFQSYQIIEQELSEDEKYRMPYLRSFTEDLVRNYNREVKMREESYVPKSVEEHLQISSRTGACHLLACASLVGMDVTATKESFDWVSTMPKMVLALCTILRLVDDLKTYEREQLTPHVASSIDSYMKQHDVSIEMARFMIEELKEEQWKDFNDEWLDPDSAQPRKLLVAIFNLTRTMEFIYNQADNFTYCHNLKDTISSLLVEAFPVN